MTVNDLIAQLLGADGDAEVFIDTDASAGFVNASEVGIDASDRVVIR